MNNLETFEDKKKQFIVTCRHQEPDRVPNLSMINNYAIGYAGKTAYDCFEELSLERECWSKVYRDVYFDGTYSFGTNHPYKAYIEYLDTETYFVSENKETIQHSPSTHMTADEYDELIKDPYKYIANKVAYRKLNALHKPYPENYEFLKKALIYTKEHAKVKAANRKYVLDELGLPIITEGKMEHPLDQFFDFIRGFKDTLNDLRRYPDKVMEVVEALTPLYSKDLPVANSNEEYPFYFDTTHIPTFLNSKQFEKFYWPYFKKMVIAAYESGTRVMVFCEGNWQQHYDLLNDLPKGAMIDLIESDDIIKAKKRIGNNITIAGGMSTPLLKFGTKQQCIDYAKGILNECAPGGGYIFAVDKSMIDIEDAKIENLIAVNEFVREYGRY